MAQNHGHQGLQPVCRIGRLTTNQLRIFSGFLRDGTMAEVDDDYILRDGEAMMVPLTFMDARRA